MKNESLTKSTEQLRCLEFFSGIGGYHYALIDSVENARVIGAFDINDTVNKIYQYNFPNTPIHQRNIQALTADYFDEENADLWTLSPPCQPFTKKGAQKDLSDKRCDALKNICSTLRQMRNPPRFLCLENVCGFETSAAHGMLIETLTQLSYSVEEFILSPLQLGIPNSRPRYYLLAKYRPNEPDRVYASNSISYDFPESSSISFGQPPRCIGDYVNDENDSDASLRVDMTNCCRYMKSIDIVSKSSHRSSCFTKSYSSYITSSGPILLCNPEYQVENPKILDVVVKICELEPNDANFAKMCSQNTLRLRYFSWREMASLMGFPFSFIKPDQVTQKQMYRALGNSVNVKVLTALLKYLLS